MSTDYSKMSDQEINMAIAEVIFPDYKVIESKSRPPSACVISHLPSKWVDYCNNQADAWPIIVGNKISIVSLDNKWIAAPVDTVIDGITGDSEVCFYASSDAVFDINPLRAAMIAFLMMQESKNAS